MLNYGTEYSYHPLSGSMFVQDKIELSEEGMLLNFGLRLDYLDPTAKRPAAERVPISEDEYQTNIVNYVPAKKKTILSPRLGFSVPYAEKGYLFINYGHYVQFPLFEQLYSGLNTAQIQKGVGALIGNPDLNPERTKAWEISIKYALEDNTVISATYFDKVTFDQIDVKTFVPTIARIAGDFGFAEFVNNAYARSMGLELLITKETGDWLIGSFSYTLMSTEGLSQDARQGLQYYQWGFEPPPKVFPLSWDQQHTIKAVFNFRLPWESDMIIIWNFNSGRPYTYYPTRDGFTPLDSTLKFLPNNERMSDVHLVQLKVTKRWKISDAINAVFYLDIRNMLNRKNVLWVDSAGKVGGELGDIMAYDSARRTRIGIRIEF
jgi:outer membrane receptor protein involved in Fe transport